jgi:hypothetical protein
LITLDGAVLGSIVKNVFDYTPPNLDSDNIPGTADDRYNEHQGGEHARTGNLTIRGVLETAIIAAGFAMLARWCPNGYAPGGSDTDPYAGNSTQWLSTAIRMRNLQVLPRLDINKASEVLQALFLDWALYQTTNNLLYINNSEILAEQFLNTYAPNQTMSHLGDPDRELGLFIQWASDTNHTNYVQRALNLYKARYISRLFPQAHIAEKNEVPIFGICAIASTYFLPSSDNTGPTHRGGLSPQYLATAFTCLTAYSLTKNNSYLQMAMDHLDWIAGRNPFSICWIDGVGSQNLPCYHHGYAFDTNNPRGAVPGAIGNGIAKAPEYDLFGKVTYVDKPAYDSRQASYFHNNAAVYSSEPWLVQNVNAMYTICTLLRYCD